MPTAESDFRSITVRENDVQALRDIAEEQFRDREVSLRTVIRRLITEFEGDGE